MADDTPTCGVLRYNRDGGLSLCGNKAHNAGKTKDGAVRYRTIMVLHQRVYICSVCRRRRNKALREMEWRRKGREYLKFRKNYCENMDGRLGYICTATIIHPASQLAVDHIDGNRENSDPKNLQTLCHNCHGFKTFRNRDSANKVEPNHPDASPSEDAAPTS